MFGLFRRGTLLGDELTEWQFDVFAWLLRHTGGMQAFSRRQLILPTPQFFERHQAQGHAFAETIFEQVRRHADMADWPCTLEAQEDDPNQLVAPTLLIQDAPSSPGGTFRATDAGAVITYHPRKVNDPMSLIATFAHELAHYRTARFPEPPSGGWDVWEPATDLTAAFFGFGIFLANTRFQFSQHMDAETMGWRSQWQGYLSEPEVLHMHAIFCALRNLPSAKTLPHLKPALRGIYKRLVKDVNGASGELAKLRAI